MRSLAAITIAAVSMLSAGPALAQKLPAPELLDATPQPGMSGPAIAAMVATIRRRVQPCADRQIIPAPEASGILAVVRLTLNRDGSLASFRILRHEGITDANRAYVPRVNKAVEGIFTGCTPILGLPPEFYDVPGGWRAMTFRYRLKS